MIKGINNFTRKSFSGYSTPSDFSFNKKNMLFGYNGKGKSSLSIGIEQEILKDTRKKEENIRLYNSDYLRLKLTNDAKTRLKGVKAMFGKATIENEKKIDELKSKLKDVEPLESLLKNDAKQIDDLVQKTEDIIRGKIKLRHAKFNMTDNVNDYLNIFLSNYNEALKIVDDDKLDTYNSAVDFDNEKNKVTSVSKLSMSIVSDDDINKLKEIFGKTYSLETVPSKELLDWIRNGIDFYNSSNNKKCLFCGSPLETIDDIEANFNKYIANTKVIDSMFVKEIKKQINDNLNETTTFIKNINVVFSIVKNDVLLKELASTLDDYIKCCELLLQNIDAKEKSFEQKFDSDTINKYFLFQSKLTSLSNALEHEKESMIQSLNKEEQKLNIILKGAIGKKIIKDKNIDKIVKEYCKTFKELEEDNKNNADIKEEIKKLKLGASPVSGFAEFINGILESLEIKFLLRVDDNEYYIVPTNSEKEISLSDISEGEKNLLSLLFFYFNLYEDDKQTKFKEEIEYIILDDPISSLDDNNHTYIISILRNILSIQNIQVFLLTHDWDDFCNISYGHDKDGNYSFFEINKGSDSHSYISRIKPTVSPYEHDFIELLMAYDKSENDIDDSDIYHLANSTRKVLEHFLEFKTVKSSPTSNNIGSIKEVLLPNITDRIPRYVLQLSTLLNVINVGSHKSSRNAHEVLSALKFLIDRIHVVDPSHYSMMKNKMSSLSV